MKIIKKIIKLMFPNKAKLKVKTEIRETENGHQVGFTIGVQTFFLKEQLSEEGMTSLVYAKWYEKQLKIAFKNFRNSLK